MRRFPLAVSGALALLACDQTDPGTSEPSRGGLTAQTASSRTIVVFKKDPSGNAAGARAIPELAAAINGQYGGRLVRTYRHALQGAVMYLPPDAIETLRHDSRVAYVEPDGVFSINGSQSNATWGLDRIDQRQLPLDLSFLYPEPAGQGVHAYVIDTGVYQGHSEFALAGGGSRVIPGYDFIDDDSDPSDCHGHGTHVAGTLGGGTYGVAKRVTLHSVRVLDCTGYGPTSAVIAGIDWVTANHVSPAVANMSLGGGYSQALNDAVANSIAAGVSYGVAAGNDEDDACAYSPASVPEALTVGATDSGDGRAFFSNTGPCLDLFAPGVDVTSAWLGSATAINTLSGTSMAAPHVVGSAALWLGLHPTATPAEVSLFLRARATAGLVQDSGDGSRNFLLYAGNMTGAGTAPEIAYIEATPSVVESGRVLTITVALTDLAPTDGVTVNLSSSDPALAVPAGLWISGGSQAASVAITAAPVASPTTVTLAASYPAGVQKTSSVTVLPSPTPQNISVSPVAVNGGLDSSVTVTLSGAAPAGDAVVVLSSSDTQVATVPATMTIPAGNLSGSVTATTFPQWTTSKSVTLTATYHGRSQHATLMVRATATASQLYLYPDSIEGGGSVSGRLSLNVDAPAGGAAVALASTDPAVNVPPTVTVPAGAYSVEFTIPTTPVSTGRLVTITATYPAGHSTTANLALLGSPQPLSLDLAPPTVWGGNSATGTVSFSGPVPAGGATLALSSSDSTKANVPATLQVAEGATAASFPITTEPQSANTWVWIHAVFNGQTIQNLLSIAPSLPTGNAVYDTTLQTPACGTPAPACDSGRLLDGRAQLGPEPHAPNTIGNSCSDGTGGFYHDRSESLDRLAIATLDGSNLAPGKQVRIEANVFAFIPTDDGAAAVGPAVVYPSDDRLDLYLTTNATASPVTWILLTPSSIVPPMGEETPLLSATVTLPATGSSNLWAIRGNYRWSGSQAVCQPRSFDDYDDLVFAVESTGPVNRPPVVDAGADVTVVLPASASLAGTVSDDGLPQPPGALTPTWTKLSGPGTVSFANPNAPATSAIFSAVGSYTLRLTANDGDATASDDVVVTVQAGNNPCAGICNNPTPFTINSRFQSGSLGTGERCYQTTSTIQHGRCSGFASSRTLKVNGTNEPCDRSWSTIPAKIAGGYCIQISAGNYSHASFSVW